MLKILKHLSEILLVSRNVGETLPYKVLRRLVDAGWHEGRTWDSELLKNYLSGFDMVFPPAALRVLSEFGGLNIGSGGRLIYIGYIEEHLCLSHKLMKSLIGEPLFPVGRTNIFEDDGLGVLIDESGRIYVDGATGSDPPRDYRVDLIETNINRFLIRLFSGERIVEKQSWYYSQADFE